MPATLGMYISQFGQTAARAQPVTEVTPASSSPPHTGGARRRLNRPQPTPAELCNCKTQVLLSTRVRPQSPSRRPAATGGTTNSSDPYPRTGVSPHPESAVVVKPKNTSPTSDTDQNDKVAVLPKPISSTAATLRLDDALVPEGVRVPTRPYVTLIPAPRAIPMPAPHQTGSSQQVPVPLPASTDSSLDTDALVVPGVRVASRPGVALIVATPLIPHDEAAPPQETASDTTLEIDRLLKRCATAPALRRPPVHVACSKREARTGARLSRFHRSRRSKSWAAMPLLPRSEKPRPSWGLRPPRQRSNSHYNRPMSVALCRALS